MLHAFNTQALRKFHVISFGSFTGIGGSDVQGYLAVAGDTTISRYSVSDQMQPPSLSERYIDDDGRNRTTRDDLVVCGDLSFISGAVMGGGNLVYTDTTPDIREPLASLYAPGVFLQVPSCPVDFDDARARLQSLSRGLASYVRTGTSVVEYTYARLTSFVFDFSAITVISAMSCLLVCTCAQMSSLPRLL